jgi:hypothetical protein
MFEVDAARLIRAQGWTIARGPYFNANLHTKKGVLVWSIKSVLSAAEMRRRGIRLDAKTGKPDHPRTVRFIGDVREGVLVAVSHLTSSDRKKIGKSRSRGRGGRVPRVSGTDHGGDRNGNP